jgi:hypothetical protein
MEESQCKADTMNLLPMSDPEAATVDMDAAPQAHHSIFLLYNPS